jgi:uncharacterized protein (TIGR04255 family)
MCNMMVDASELLADLGHPVQPLLRNAPLFLVACQMQYPTILGFSEASVASIQKDLEDDFPEVGQQVLQQVEFGPTGINVTGEAQRIFRFETTTKDWAVSVGPTAVALETRAYAGFRDFAPRWHAVISACVEALSISRQNRIGLRYINHLDAAEDARREDLARLVHEDLLGPIGAQSATERVFKSWQELRFHQDGGDLTLQHGYAERPPNGWAYVLDFDHYDDEGQPVDLAAQVRVLGDFNHRVYDLFKWAINDKQFASFDPQERGQ